MNNGFGLSTRTLAAGFLELDYLETAGPRIVGLRYKGSVNLLASAPEISIPPPIWRLSLHRRTSPVVRSDVVITTLI